MKVKYFGMAVLAAAAIALAASCNVDDYEPGQKLPPAEEEKFRDRVEGRNVVAYCTYYGTSVPDGRIVTHINYAFAELYVRDGKYLKFALQGSEERFRQVISVKQKYPQVKICLSFSHTVSNGDNWQDGGFSVMASTEEGRKAFAKDCLNFITKWGIDGIDIDWEFPGISWSGHACNPAVDIDNFTLLMKQLRETLGDSHLLTYAGYCMDKRQKDDGWKFIDIKAVDPYVDFVNIMTYDLDEAPHHQSAIRSSSAYWDCERTVNEYFKAGISPSKMVLGIPFYARHSFSTSPTAIDYRKIITLDQNVYKIDNWDEAAGVPYITEKATGKYYAGYDNPDSIARKAKWILGLKMKGLMYWDYDADDSQGTLRKAVWNSVMGD